MLIGPSERVDVLATAGAAGSYSLMQEKTDTGPLGDMSPPQEMASIMVAPNPSRPAPLPLGPIVVNAPKQLPVPAYHIDARRLVVFSEDVTTGLFFINHQTFDPKRTDIRVPLGSTEEWTVRNASQELHVFHIHQVPFQVVSINGKPQPFVGLRDTIDVPIHGEVKIRMAFTDPRIVGRFMYHCHILEHEDKGMMATIEVYDPKHDKAQDAKMSEHDALEAHTRDELGITDTSSANPLQAAIASAASFLAGGCPPLLVALIAPSGGTLWAIVIVGVLTLSVLGAAGARAGGAPMLPAIVRVVFWGSIAMAITGAVGRLFHATVG